MTLLLLEYSQKEVQGIPVWVSLAVWINHHSYKSIPKNSSWVNRKQLQNVQYSIGQWRPCQSQGLWSTIHMGQWCGFSEDTSSSLSITAGMPPIETKCGADAVQLQWNWCRQAHDKITGLNLIRPPCNRSLKESYLTLQRTVHEN